jgi:hypothetical protein
MTSPKQTSLFGEDKSTFSQEVFPVNHIAQQESEREKKTNAIYGQKCLEQFGKFNHAGLWAKMFSELLIGTGEWYSKRCKLTWRLKGTKYKRMYFQLQVSTLPTKDTGSGLLLTPTSIMTLEDPKEMRARAEKNGYKNGTQYGSLLSQVVYGGLLPTPVASDGTIGAIIGKNDTFRETSTGLPRKINQNGVDGSLGLGRMAGFGLLPTPTATSDAKGESTRKEAKRQNDTLAHCVHGQLGKPGKTSQLNPRFVLEMMGFEPGHCDSAFETIAWDYYLKKKSTKSFQKRLADGSKKP